MKLLVEGDPVQNCVVISDNAKNLEIFSECLDNSHQATLALETTTIIKVMINEADGNPDPQNVFEVLLTLAMTPPAEDVETDTVPLLASSEDLTTSFSGILQYLSSKLFTKKQNFNLPLILNVMSVSN